MKRFIKSLLLVMIIVPVMVVLAACGGSSGKTTNYTLTGLKYGAATFDLADKDGIIDTVKSFGVMDLTDEELGALYDTVIEGINALDISVSKTEFSIRLNLNKVIDAVMSYLDEGSAEEQIIQEEPTDGTDNTAVSNQSATPIFSMLTMLPSVKTAIIFEYKIDGNKVSILNADGTASIVNDYITIEKGKNTITLTLGSGTIEGVAAISLIFTKA